ncbi:MAG: hypothetical protein J2P55_10685 [Rhizobiales bacterium]|nr:hypothetical protein [Hyphomicrobiales bacterium]
MTAKSLKHRFASAVSEGTDSTIVGPNEWNNDHDLWLGTRVYSTGSNDTITNADHLSWIIYNCGANIAANLPAPTTGPPATMPLGWTTKIKSVGAGIITLTPTSGATFNGSSNPIALYTGDAAEIFSQGTVDYVVLVFRAAALLGNAGHSGRLAYASATALAFKPFNGGYLRINGVLRPIPIAGIAGLANTGVFVNGTAAQNLAANQTYLVYAFDNGGVLTADFCTGTTHAPSQTPNNIGVEVKWLSGVEDPTRTLIGMCRTNASSQFFDDGVSQIGVASWQNRRPRLIPGVGTGSIAGIGATTPTFFGGPATVLGVVTWADAAPDVFMTGLGLITADGDTVLCNIGVNNNVNTTILPVALRVAAATGGSNLFQSWSGHGQLPCANPVVAYNEGWNTFGVVAWVNAASGTINNTISAEAFI